jgi:catechol 2,3-dioxygenase-like lactoylglutathione lyase family enzyme
VGFPGAGAGATLGAVTSPDTPRVRQLRLVVEAEDFQAAAAFYRDALGLPVELDLEGEAGEHVLILDAGRATLELSNPAQVAMIDEVEVGRRVAPRIRVAFEVADAAGTTEALVEAGARVLAPPTRTPWDSLNARLEAPAALQITVFEEQGPT